MTGTHLESGLRHKLRPDNPFSRESLAFMLQLPEAGIAACAYTWVNGAGRAGALLTAFGPGVEGGRATEFVDDIPVDDAMNFDKWVVGPLRLTIPDPMQSAIVEVSGKKLGISYHFDATHPAYLYSNHPEGSPAFFADDRYEQSGRVRGELRIGGRVFEIDTTAHRDHSWGTRDWGSVQHYKWIVSQAGPDTAVHVFDIHALGRRYLRGYVQKDGIMAEVRDVDCSFDHDSNWWQSSVDATIVDAASRTTHFRSETFAGFRAKHGPLTAIETGMRVVIDDQPGIGHVEIAWPTTYFNHLIDNDETSV